jgi:hypothetical protein
METKDERKKRGGVKGRQVERVTSLCVFLFCRRPRIILLGPFTIRCALLLFVCVDVCLFGGLHEWTMEIFQGPRLFYLFWELGVHEQ